MDPGFPVGGVSTLIGGGANLRHRRFLVKTYVKMKEFGPVGGCMPETFVCRSATVDKIFAKPLDPPVFLWKTNFKVFYFYTIFELIIIL